MRQATARLIIEGAPIGPGILQVLTGDDHNKLHHIGHRLKALGTVIGLIMNESSFPAEVSDVLAHVGSTVDDIAQLADALVRTEETA